MPAPEGYDPNVTLGYNDEVMQEVCRTQVGSIGVQGRYEGDGYFHIFADGSALDDETMIAYTAEEFAKLPRVKHELTGAEVIDLEE
jgi:hypothetical protein